MQRLRMALMELCASSSAELVDHGVRVSKPSPRSHRRSLAQSGERRGRRGVAAIPLVDPSERQAAAFSVARLCSANKAMFK